MDIQENKAVVVANISPNANEKTVSDFFSFCGKITKLYLKKDDNADTSTAVVQFESESAAKTALLLTNALIVDRPITVSAYVQPQQNNNAETAAPVEANLGTQVDESQITQREFNVPDEQRTKTSVVASLLAAGYVLTSDAFVKAKEVDEKHMFSLQAKVAVEQVKVKAHEIDVQFGISEKAAAIEKTVTDTAKQIDESLKITETAQVAANFIVATAQQTAQKINQATESNTTLKGLKARAQSFKNTMQTTFNDVKEQTQKAIEEKQKGKPGQIEGGVEVEGTAPVTTTTTTTTEESSTFVNSDQQNQPPAQQ